MSRFITFALRPLPRRGLVRLRRPRASSGTSSRPSCWSSRSALSAINGLKFGVEFSGGAVFTVPSETCTIETARDAAGAEVPEGEPIVTELTGSSGRQIRVQTVDLTPAETRCRQHGSGRGLRRSAGGRVDAGHRPVLG